MMRHITGLLLSAILLITGGAASVTTQAGNSGPLSIARQGYLFAGGTYTTVNRRQVMSGQMYAEFQIPGKQTHAWPIVMVHGGGQTGTNFTGTPDSREGWAQYFLRQGYAVYVVDQVGRGRSAYAVDVYGPPTASPNPAEGSQTRFAAPERYNAWPQAHLHTQWPGKGAPGDPIFDQFFASQVTGMQANAVQLNRDAILALLGKIGPAIVLTHSQSGPIGWPVADARPDLVKALISVEPGGPPFHGVDYVPAPEWFRDAGASENIWGVTAVPIGFSPPAAKASDLAIERQTTADAPDLARCWMQKAPARLLLNLAKVRHLIVTSEASYHANYDHCTVKFLEQAGVHPTFIKLADVGIKGNGHMMMLEKNNTEIAAVISTWLTRSIPDGASRAAQTPADAGRQVFVARCAGCHGSDGNGGELGPGIASRVPSRTDQELTMLLGQGLPAAGMPAFSSLSETDTDVLVRYLRTLKPSNGSGPVRTSVTLAGGRALAGLVLNQSTDDLQLLGDDRKIHLLRKSGRQYRVVTSQADWPSYNGQTNGSRYSALGQINKTNVGRLAPRWIFSLPNTSRLQVTPVVVDGVMYVTSANECYALDAGSGREIWHYQRARTKGLVGNAAGGVNRGVGVAGDRVFMVTDHAHLIALNRSTGALLWETEMADWHQNYNATGAPLPVGALVVTGSSGGDEGVRGFVAAFDQSTGKEAWRFWTVPRRGEPGSETWQGKGIEHPGGTTWMTGAYDPQLDLVYWPVGNPGPDLVGDDRLGDNLHTDSIVALDPKTGALKWHFQFTPHDVWDYDAEEPPALVDAMWQGQPRKLLVQANRNGFLYVLDRTNGTFLFGTQYVKNLTWATGLTAEGRPIRVPNMEPSLEGTRVCPSLDGASNWYSTSFNATTGLYYVQTNDKCGIFTRTPTEWEAGKGFMGGSFRQAPDEPAQRVLRAIDIHTGKAVWELPQTGAVNSWGGTLSTAGGLVIFGEDSGALMAADAANGKPLWSFQTSQLWKASPMTYLFDNKQYVAVAAGSNIIAFGLPE